MYVYIAGPYTKGDVAQNVRAAIDAAEALRRAGHTPYCPHLTHFQHMIYPHLVEYWYALDLEWLERCDALLRLPGESVGADNEVAFARIRGMPVYTSIAEISANFVWQFGGEKMKRILWLTEDTPLEAVLYKALADPEGVIILSRAPMTPEQVKAIQEAYARAAQSTTENQDV